jgi:hypothetical protein
MTDEEPDLTFLGEFSDRPGQFAIHHSDDSRVGRYFNAYNVSSKAEARQNYERMLRFCSGDICIIGVRAEAQIITSLNLLDPSQSAMVNHISSCGLWGIESDSDKEYVKEIEKGELGELRHVLTSLGFTAEQIDGAPIKRDS